ncbi:MAG: hypothetical protein VX966_04000 [Chloroflexota bacterium]|nr:hypothetical protein [Chloroflexota bacterium]
MFRGILVGLGIVVVCIAIPIVHFITFPIGPFIAGYVGIEFVENRTDSASWRGLKYGACIGAASLPVFALIGFILIALSDFGARNSTLIWIFVGIFTLYAGSMSALGAMYSAMKAEMNEKTVSEGAVD